METELPDFCYFTNVWHEGEPEARTYPGKSRQHVTTSSRLESGSTLTSCERCGACAKDY